MIHFHLWTSSAKSGLDLLSSSKMTNDDVMCDVEEIALGVWRCLMICIEGNRKECSRQNRENEKQQNQELVWEKGWIRKMENRFVTESMDQGSGDSWFF